MGKARIEQVFDHARRTPAMLVAGLLLAACSNGPWAGAPQSASRPTVAPTLAALGQPPAIANLKGLAPEQVTALIGDPDLRRTDPPAEIWQYRSADCVLELYFYDSGASRRMIYAETHSRTPQHRPGDIVACSQNLGPLTPATRQTKL
ncbi:MAG: hypothetical protein KGJ66_07770 [Alphaproteobacteria bacterium]|nr:hypothetical protein [Alphaproteobacteria bacterium]